MIHWRRLGGAVDQGARRLSRVVSEALVAKPGAAILHDPREPGPWVAERFDPGAWAEAGYALDRAVGGRGAVVFVERPGDDDWALRHYHRGGLPGQLLEDQFVWLGPEHTRSFREWRLLRRLFNDGLPVPRPVAAGYRRRGLTYVADLITARIPAAEPLAAHVARGPLGAATWRGLGHCVRRFHDAGVFHADLNVHNLLLDDSLEPWLLDFDRGRLRAPGGWRRANLDRFLRSLRKLRAERPGVHIARADWEALLDGYGQMPA